MPTIKIFLLISLFVLSNNQIAHAALEEIVVTAQKREQSLRDVPISISVTSGETLENLSIGSLEELSGSLPNVTIAENATQDSITVRGIGSGANHGFEQSVGTFIDGVYFGRGRSSRSPFLDIERVEILKGPQGVLFGKNTIAGALNITTRKPTEEREGYIEGEYFEGDESFGITAMLSGPLSDRVNGRLVGRITESDGYVKNIAPGASQNERESFAVRGVLDFNVSDKLGITLKAEAASYDAEGRHLQLVEAGPRLANYQSVDPNFEQNFDYVKSVNNGVFGDDFDYTDSQNLSATLRYDFENVTLVATSAFVGYEYNNNIPANFSANIETATKFYDEEHDQFSQEVRLESSLGGKFEYMVGAFYQTEDIDHVQDFAFDTTQGRADGFPLPPFVGVSNFDIEQTTDSIALFAQGTWSLTERLKATLGLRYTDDSKDINYVQTTTGRLPFPTRSTVDTRDDSETTPALNIQYDLGDNVMLYGNFSQGFKSGGFDFESGAQFEDETVDSIEIGFKALSADGSLELNAALFDSQFENLQVAAWNGIAFVTSNAAEATTQGVELDFRWQLTDTVQLSGAVAFLNGKYDNFTTAICHSAQQIQHGIRTGRNPNTCVQDLSGRSLQFSPDYAGNLNIEFDRALNNGMDLTTILGVEFSDASFTALDLDPISEQGSYAKLNARVQLANEDKWSVALVGKNLTDEATTTWINDVPFFRGAYFGSIDPPRSFGVQVRVAW
ncbi:MAG: TonB-dependent receptor [Candidatus Azotimanducaceae bacterium WSBS_2022_MAG_OTU7]